MNKIYRVYDPKVPDQLRGGGYNDSYDSFVVIAKDADQAVSFPEVRESIELFGNFDITELGIANDSCKVGIVLGSMNSTG